MPVPDRDGVHAFELDPGVVTPDRIGCKDSFRIALGVKPVASCFEVGAQLSVIEHLAIEDDGISSRRVVNRLVAADHINDRQAAHAHAEIFVDQVSMIIRAAMTNSIALPCDVAFGHALPVAHVPSGNTADGSSSQRPGYELHVSKRSSHPGSYLLAYPTLPCCSMCASTALIVRSTFPALSSSASRWAHRRFW